VGVEKANPRRRKVSNMNLDKLLDILKAVSPQVAAVSTVIQIIGEGIQHIRDTGNTTIPAELEQKLQESLARRQSVNDEFDQILRG
jgi:uncharacterized protein YdeI (YjbR/CyaY-like superfamily)